MAELIAIAYPDQERAASALNTMKLLHDGRVIDVEQAVAISRDSDGSFKSVGGRHDAGRGAVAGALIGTVVGMIFALPAVGALFGAASGAVGGSIADVGRIGDFVTQVSDKMEPGSSLLLMLLRGGSRERLLEELGAYKGTLVSTTLPDDAEARIRAALGELSS